MSTSTDPTTRPAATVVRRPPAPIRTGSAAEVLSVVSACFTVLGVVCVWLAVQLPFLSTLSQNRAQDTLYPAFRTALASATAPTGGTIRPGRAVALLTVSRLGLRQVVVEGTSATELRSGPGHRRDTVLPGQTGISVVYGRATTYGGPFSQITSLQPGDLIVAQMAQGRVVYTVRDVRRAGDPIPALPTGSQGRLTLVTAEGHGALASLRPSSAVYVDATAEKTFVGAAGRPAAIPANEQVMASDPAALPVLVLCLAVLLGVAWALTAAFHRWSRALVWVVGAPVVTALAWFTSDVVVRLLPNLM